MHLRSVSTICALRSVRSRPGAGTASRTLAFSIITRISYTIYSRFQSKYIEKLQEIAKEHPNLNVVYSRDDEGNGYQEVTFDPTIGNFNETDGFIDKESIKTEEDFNNLPVNSICIN